MRAGSTASLTPGTRVTVQADAPDGQLAWAFDANTLRDDGESIELEVHAGEPVAGPAPWSWPADGRYVLWRTRPYSVLTTTRAVRFPYWYAAVHTPVVVEDGRLWVTDLGASVQLFADGRYSVTGEDALATRPDLDEAPRATVHAAVAELVMLIAARHPPFSHGDLPGR